MGAVGKKRNVIGVWLGLPLITLGIYTYLGNYSTDWGAVMAAGVFAMVPAGILLVVAQRYIASGLTAGSVKG